MAETRVFVVHGQDDALIPRVEDLIRRMGATPVVLRSQGDGGATLLEKFLREADRTDLAIALVTPDNLVGEGVRVRDGLLEEKHYTCSHPVVQPRGNVLIEIGYFFGKIGRENLILLKQDHPEGWEWDWPSDLNGLMYVPVETGWEHELVSEISKRTRLAIPPELLKELKWTR